MTYEPSVMKYLYGKRPLTVESYDTVSHAIDLMENANKNAIGVQNFGKFAGIFTQSDFIKRVLRHDLNPGTTSIYDVMTAHPQIVTPDCGITTAYEIMVRRAINHLPVVDHETGLKGIITAEELRADVQDWMDKTIKEYKMVMGYIHGESYGIGSHY